MKIKILNSKIMHKSKKKKKKKKMMGLIRSLLFDFILYFFTTYDKVPYTCNISAGYNTKYTIHLLKKQIQNIF